MNRQMISRLLSMRLAKWLVPLAAAIVVVVVALSIPAIAQRQLTIIEPQPGAVVKEDLTVTVAKPRPGEGYLIYKVDGVLKEASAEVQFVLDTKELADGEHTLVVEDHDGTGAIVGRAEVKFIVANKIGAADATTSAVPLFHWDYQQFLDKEITTYVLWAQGIATSAKKKTPTAAGAGGEGGGQVGQQGPDVIVLDRQLSLKIRQMIRDVSADGTANIRTIVEGGHERWRHYEQASMDPEEPPNFAGAGGWCFSGGGGGRTQGAEGMAGPGAGPAGGMVGPGGGQGTAMAVAEPVKVWDGEGSCELCMQYKETGQPPVWCPSAEVGRTYTKKIYRSGKEVNATRKYEVWPYEHATRFAMSELQPMFADHPVRPGDQWNSTMTFVCELAERRGVTVTVPLKFVGFEWQGGRKTAKLQTEFDMPEPQAKEVAMVCIDFVGAGQQQVGAEGGGAGGGLPMGAFQGTEKKKPPRFISPPRVHVKRTIYFDYARKKILRTEDQVTSRFVFKPPKQAAGMMGGGMMPGGGMAGGGAPQQSEEPENWTYNVTIITQLDESNPEPAPNYNKRTATGPRDYDHVMEKTDRPVPPNDPKAPRF